MDVMPQGVLEGVVKQKERVWRAVLKKASGHRAVIAADLSKIT